MLNANNKNIIWALLIFILVTVLFTSPLLAKIGSAIPGFFSTDEPSIWYIWWLGYAQENSFDTAHCHLLAYPFGLSFSVIEDAFPAWTLMRKALASINNIFIAYNIEILLTFLLSSLFMFLLVRYLTKDTLLSIFAGIAYAFCPYHFARVWQHINLAHIEWLPLYLLALFKLRDSPRVRISLFFIIALFLVFSFDLYYGYFAFIMTVIFLIYNLCVAQNKKKVIIANMVINGALAGLLVIVVLIPLFSQFFLSSISVDNADWNIIRPFKYLFSQSARPLSYLLPSPQLPVFGCVDRTR